MTDNQKTIFLRKVLSSEEILHLKMKYIALTFLNARHLFNIEVPSSPTVLGFFITLSVFYIVRSLEETQQLEVERALVLANQGSVMWQLEKGNMLAKGQIESEDLSQCITAVCGVILPRLTPRPEEQVLVYILFTAL